MPRVRPSSRSLAVVAVAAVVGALVVLALAPRTGAPVADPLPANAPLATQVAVLEEAAAADPSDVRSRQRLGAVYLARALETGDPSWYARSEAVLAQATALAPDAPETLVTRAALQLSLHDFRAALDLAEQAREGLPASPAVLGALVDAQVELGRYDDAALTLQEMLDRRPALPALSRTSYLRQLNGSLPGAVVAMEQARDAGSGAPFDVAVVEALLGELHLIAGDVDAASAAAQRALDLVPTAVVAEVLAAKTEAATGDVPAAVRRLEGVRDRYPATVVTTLLAQLQRLAGDPAAAEQTERLVEATARLQEAAGQSVDLEAALFEADTGDATAALEYARSAEALRPDNVFVASAMAWALHVSGDDEAALPYVERALRLGTVDPLVHFHAAVVLAEVGQDERAAEELRVVTQSPWFSFGHLAQAGELAARLGVDAPPAWRDALAADAAATELPQQG